MSIKVKIRARPETLTPQERLDHTDNLRALLVHSGRIKIIDLDKGIRTDRMSHGSCVFRELG